MYGGKMKKIAFYELCGNKTVHSIFHGYITNL